MTFTIRSRTETSITIAWDDAPAHSHTMTMEDFGQMVGGPEAARTLITDLRRAGRDDTFTPNPHRWYA